MPKTINTACHFCEKETYHNVLFEKIVKGIDENYSSDERYITLQCGGCQSISFLIRSENPDADEDFPFFDSNFSTKTTAIPDFNFLRDDDQDELPSKTYELYNEVKDAFNKGLNILAGMGLRMLVESICLEQKIIKGTLANKIQELHTIGMISKTELPILDKLRLIGNQSAHEIKSFPAEKLAYALDIINHVLISIYVLPKINRRLKL